MSSSRLNKTSGRNSRRYHSIRPVHSSAYVCWGQDSACSHVWSEASAICQLPETLDTRSLDPLDFFPAEVLSSRLPGVLMYQNQLTHVKGAGRRFVQVHPCACHRSQRVNLERSAYVVRGHRVSGHLTAQLIHNARSLYICACRTTEMNIALCSCGETRVYPAAHVDIVCVLTPSIFWPL